MDFLYSMVNEQRMHQDEILLLAILQALDVKSVNLSVGEVPLKEAIAELEARIEKNVSAHLQRSLEAEANEALGKKDTFGSLFGGL